MRKRWWNVFMRFPWENTWTRVQVKSKHPAGAKKVLDWIFRAGESEYADDVIYHRPMIAHGKRDDVDFDGQWEWLER